MGGHRRALAALLAVTLAVGSAGCSRQAADSGALRLPELAWVGETADPVRALTTRPAACSHGTDNDDERRLRFRGEILFASPALLGGKAAQAGLSCESCHRNGRGNGSFFFPGHSSAAGTADVSSGFFSSSHGDNSFNPVPIPDLAAASGLKHPDRTGAAFRDFVATLIEGEFSGQPVPAPAMDALIAYLAAISPAGCPPGVVEVAVSWRQDFALATGAVGAGRDYLLHDDPATARLYINAGRRLLGLVHARFQAPGAVAAQPVLEDVGRALGTVIALIDSGKPAEEVAALLSSAALGERLAALESVLESHAPESYYEPATLAAALRPEQPR